LGIGDWGLGIGDWGWGPIPNTQNPKPQTPNPIFLIKLIFKNNFKKKLNFYLNLKKNF